MPIRKPKKGESKQDYLKYCTSAEIKAGMEADQAYAVCNDRWDREAGKGNALTLTHPLQLVEEEDGEGPKRFMITAYTGKVVDSWFRKIAINVKGMTAKNKIPVLREHQRDRVVGFGDKSWSENDHFYVTGQFSRKTLDGKESLELAEEGYPWQASVGIWPLKVKVLEDDKQEETVNGQTVKGPAEIWTESLVGEVSFVSLGADDQTAAIVLNADGDRYQYLNIKEEVKKMPNSIKELKNEYPELVEQIEKEAHEAAYTDGLNAGIEQERSRVVEILEADGDRTVTLDLIRRGTDSSEAFKAFYETLKNRNRAALKEMAQTATQPVEDSKNASAEPETATTDDPDEAGKILSTKAKALKRDKGISYSEAFSRVKSEHPDLFDVYMSKSRKQ